MEQSPEIQLTQEIRFALVMYGGMSLAIYMNGVAQELRKMVATTAANRADDARREYRTDAELKDTKEQVYQKLARMLSWGGAGGVSPLFDGGYSLKVPPRWQAGYLRDGFRSSWIVSLTKASLFLRRT